MHRIMFKTSVESQEQVHIFRDNPELRNIHSYVLKQGDKTGRTIMVHM